MSRILLLIAVLLSFSRISAQTFLRHFSSVDDVVALNDKVYFSADNGVSGMELWVSDGTREGTILLKDIFPGSAGSFPDHLTVLNGSVFFTATSAQHGRELWKTDGTAAGTTMVKDIYPGVGNNSNPSQLIVFQSQIFFGASADGFNHQLYRSDGTSTGTAVVKDLGIAQINETAVAETQLYFVAGESALWKSDGTGAGTAAVAVDANPFIRQLTPAGNTLYFTTGSGDQTNSRLYKREGTQTPVLLKSFDAPGIGQNSLTDLTVVDAKLFFNLGNSYEAASMRDALWISDGTPAGTQLVKSFLLDTYSMSNTMRNFISFQGKLFFQQGSSLNREFWVSDGTNSGTSKISDVQTDASSTLEIHPAISDGKLFFSGDGELWISDGTVNGTRQLFDLNQTALSVPHQLIDAQGVLYFAASDEYGTALWTNAPAAEVDVRDDENSSSLFSGVILDFGTLPVDQCNARKISIRNAGMKELILVDATVSGKDYFLAGALPASVAPGESHVFDLIFVPFAQGKREGTLILRNADSNESEFIVSLRGIGTESEDETFCSAFDDAQLKKRLSYDQSEAAIEISSNTISENAAPGTLVGKISVVQSAGTYQYSLVSGEGDDDNNYFTLTGNNLYTARAVDYDEKSVLTVRIRATEGDTEWESGVPLIVVPTNVPSASGGPCAPVMKRLSGGILDVEFNQQGELFAVGDGGKLLRSVNIGNTWLPMNSGVTTSLSKILFKGAAGYAIGNEVLLKSDDHGVTWFELYTPFAASPRTVFFLDAQNGIAAGTDGSFFQTTDGGKQWYFTGKEFPGAPTAVWFWDLNNGMASTAFGSLLRTDDGGATWTTLNGPVVGPGNGINDIYFTDDDHGFLLSNAKLYKSDNGGEEWYDVSGVSGFGLEEIRFVDLNTAYIVGGSWSAEVFISTSGGTNWDPVSMDPMTAARGIAVNPAGTTVVIAGNNSADPFFSAPGQVFMSAAAGASSGWQIRNQLRAQTFHAVEFPTATTGFLFGEFSAFKTLDGGYSWQLLNVPSTVTGAAFSDASNGFIATGHHIHKTSNGGGSWTQAFAVPSAGPAYLASIVRVSSNVYIAYGPEGLIYRTGDGGTTWPTVFSQPLNQLVDITFSSGLTGYGLDLLGKVIKTTNGGASWSVVYTHPVAGDFFNSIVFLNDATGFIGGKDGLILKTTNGGSTWNPVFSGISTTISQLIFETASVGYAFTEDGLVYQTRDGAGSWNPFGALSYIGLSDVSKFLDKIYFTGSFGNLGKIDLPMGPTMPGYISGDQVVCQGDVIDLHLAGTDNGSYYTWQIPGVSFNAHNEWLTARVDGSGTFTASVKKTDACGSSGLRTLSISVKAPPQPVVVGPEEVSAAMTELYYVETPGAESRFGWIVSEALESDPNLDQVDVTWGNTDGRVTVVETDLLSGCRASDVLVVNIDPATIVGLGPDGNAIDASVWVYPNPTSDVLILHSNYNAGLEVKMFDLNGRLMRAASLEANDRGELNISHLPSGLYLLEIVNLRGHSKTVKKIIKR